MEHLSNDHEDHPNQHKNSNKLCNETGHPNLCLKKSIETEITTSSELPNGGKATVEKILVSQLINKAKRPGLQKSQSRIQVGKLSI